MRLSHLCHSPTHIGLGSRKSLELLCHAESHHCDLDAAKLSSHLRDDDVSLKVVRLPRNEKFGEQINSVIQIANWDEFLNRILVLGSL